jgi:ligand-binding SRPBCC domain-containing protein
MTIIEKSVTIAAPIEAVFDFHLDTDNLGLISPAWVKTKLIREQGDGLGKIIELHTTQYNVFPSHWVVRIEEYDRPVRLTDLMLQGPMKYFRHERTFSQPCASLTELKDHLEYETPFGIIGKIADKLSIEKMMNEMFEYRHQKTKEILEARFYIREIPVEDARRL